jgi:methylenetetrahydrofolate reductase (NADPH)
MERPVKMAEGVGVDSGVSLTALRVRLENPCFEIIPLKGVEKQIPHIPAGSDVAITCSPDKGIPATLDLTRRLGDRGFTLIPHIAARMVSDEAHLRDILAELDDLGIHRMFVVGGDAEQPAGRFDSSLQLLEIMSEIDHRIETVGIGAYPEGHPLIDDQTLLAFLKAKQPYASYMITQMCFDPEVIVEWLRSIRAEGVDLPVHVGVPGVAGRGKLLQIALKIGVGQSAQFLKSNRGLVGKMMAPGGYSPDELLLALAPCFDAPPYRIEGVHFYSFNQIESTERWRAEMLARLRGGKDASP